MFKMLLLHVTVRRCVCGELNRTTPLIPFPILRPFWIISSPWSKDLLNLNLNLPFQALLLGVLALCYNLSCMHTNVLSTDNSCSPETGNPTKLPSSFSFLRLLPRSFYCSAKKVAMQHFLFYSFRKFGQAFRPALVLAPRPSHGLFPSLATMGCVTH